MDRTAEFLAERFESRNPRQEPGVDAVDGALADLERRLVRGPASDLVRAKRWRPGVRSARAFLRRLLKPYLESQRELDMAIEKAIALNRAELRRIESSLGELGTDSSKEIRHIESSLGQLEMDVSTELRRIESSLGEHGAALGEHGAAVSEIRGHLERIESELTAVPYMSDPESLRTVDNSGRPVIGFRDSSSSTESGYRTFEDTFRGPEEFIRERQRPYLDLIGARAPVLDVGCGRGEFLELMAEAGIEARGIDVDLEMVARCREKGLAVEQADALSYLDTQPDGSIGVVFSAQVIEHLSHEQLTRFFQLAERKLALGGLFVAETVNPHSIQAFKAFWVDLTHRAPIFPEVAVTLARLYGFESAYVFFPLGSGELEIDRRNCGEYALVARRAT